MFSLRSYKVEDEPVLRHIPYIGDEDSEGFLDDLATNYDDVSHLAFFFLCLLPPKHFDRSLRAHL